MPGDLVSFVGQTPHTGNFSQQIAIIVDAVGTGGAITQWHFLWGGLYDASVFVSNTMVQDPIAAHNRLQGSPTPGAGAVLKPAWSGWSLLNNQTMGSGGMNYKPGDTITLSENSTLNGTMDGSLVNQKQYPTLVVETVDNSGGSGIGAVVSYDWLDYGSYSQLPTPTPLTLSSVVTSGMGKNFTISPAQWTQAPLLSTIDYVDTSGPLTSIYLTENFSAGGTPQNALPTAMPVQFLYYGDDDSGAINKALSAQNSGPTATGGGGAFFLPGACGATASINLPQNTTANFVNPSLVGGNFQSTGLYAFAAPLAARATTPVLSRLIYAGLANAAGGGFRDMFVEAMGAPEGYGYYGMTASSPTAPTGYVGPSAGPTTPFPTAGDAVEIDSGPSLRISNVHISDGGIGSGNSVLQCGLDESDPTGVIRGAAFSNIAFTDSRLDGNSLYSGATDPDTSLRLANSCRGSVFQALSVYDGTKADILAYNGNLLSQTHLNSDAANSPTSANPGITFTAANSGFAGFADYGVYAIGNTTLAQTQCDIANLACVFVLPPTPATLAAGGAGQITDTQMKCGALQSVPPSYHGVELGAGVVNTTVGGTASSGKCNVPAAQLVVLDGPINQTVSLCNNSNAAPAYCAGYQSPSGFAAMRYYTQPSLGYTTVQLSGAASGPTTLYGIPFVNPTGGTITQMGIQVTTVGSGTAPQCELGIYSSANGLPGNLLLDSGPVSVIYAQPRYNTGLNLVLSPNTLYFLAIGCNTVVSVEGTTGTNGLAGLLLGEPDLTTFGATNVTGSWSAFAAHALPATFGAAMLLSTPAAVPNVYVGP